MDLNTSLLQIVKLIQSAEFSETLRLLRDVKPLKGSIRRLNPFLDSHGHLRVGGRLVKSDLTYESRHPLLLPKSHHVTKLIVDHYHRMFLHPGLMALNHLLQRKFWIPSARRVIRKQIFQCMRCYRLRPKALEPFMGDLPVHRVQSCRPFQKAGVDFAGPYACKTSRIRNPPSSPHMGGLWESAVRSAKLILVRVIGERALTFEELSTVFSKVEAALNSRPLCPVSNDPNDLEALTPGHFVIGQPLQALPEQDLLEFNSNLLKRWHFLRQITQHFWKRWHSEYLHTMQQRPKWLSQSANLQVGDLVLIRDSNLPPLQWKKGRITRVCPGTDGTVRVVELRTHNGVLLRPVVKLCPLLPKL